MQQLLDWFGMLVERGGPVMYPLFGVSVLSLALILERTAFWLRLHRRAVPDRLEALSSALRSGERSKSARLANAGRTSYHAIARALLNSGASDSAAIDAAQRERPRFERFMVTLSTIITAAPWVLIE